MEGCSPDVAGPSLLDFLQVASLAPAVLSCCDAETLGALRATCRAALAAVRVHCTTARWHTRLRHVREPERLGDLSKYPALTHLKLVSAHGVSAGCVSAVVSAAGPRLMGLDLSDNKLGPEEAAALAAAAGPGLRELQLQDNQLGDEGVAQLLAPPLFAARLRTLHLQGNRLGLLSAAALGSASLPCLQVLSLGGNQLRAEAAAALLCLGERVETGMGTGLGLPHGGGGPGGALGLNSGPSPGPGHVALPALRELYLDGNRLGPRGAAALAAGVWPALCKLDVRWNKLGPTGAAELARRPDESFPMLQVLHVEGNELGPHGAAALASNRWGSLQVLHCGGNDIGDSGASSLAEAAASGALPGLSRLMLRSNVVGDEGARRLATASWEALRCMHLADNHLSLEGERALTSSGWLCEVWRGADAVGVYVRALRAAAA